MYAIDSLQAPPIGKVLDTVTFRMPRGFFSCLVVPGPGSHVIIAGRGLMNLRPAPPGSDPDERASLESAESNFPAGFHAPSAATMSETLSLFLIASDRGFALHSSQTGALVATFTDIMRAPIFSLALEPLQLGDDGAEAASARDEHAPIAFPSTLRGHRRVYLGDLAGDIGLFSVVDGTTVATATNGHTHEVVKMVPFAQDGILFSASADRSIRCFDVRRGVGCCARVHASAHARR